MIFIIVVSDQSGKREKSPEKGKERSVFVINAQMMLKK